MRIFLAGDHLSGTGPANVTQYYIDNLPKGTLYQKMRGKLARVPEIIVNTARADVIVYSGYSKQNILGMKLAKLFGKKTAYLMHGCVEYENEINKEVDSKMCQVERTTMELADAIFAVSKTFALWLRDNYREYAEKIDYVENAIDDSIAARTKTSTQNERDSHVVMSIGGGMPRKQIKYICEAVKLLREEYDPLLKLVVVGAKGADSDAVDAYPFVEDKGVVPFKECIKLLQNVAVFIQNSCFETFGLATVEAISCGCAVLNSKEIGALCLFNDMHDEDIIDDYSNPREIADKIKIQLEHPNTVRLQNGIDWENNTWKIRSRVLVEKLSELIR